LAQDSRQPLAAIAKKTMLSKQVVDYRIRNMIKSGLIKKFITVVNWKALGYMSFRLYLQLEKISEEELRAMIEELKTFDGVYFVGLCEGKVNVVIRFLVRSVDEFKVMLEKTIGRFGKYIWDKQITLVTEDPLAFTSPGAYIWGDTETTVSKNKKKGDINVDETDLEIVRELTENSRKSAIEIAKEIGRSPDNTSYRIKRMVKSGAILGFRCFIDSTELGFEHRKIFLRMNYFDSKKKQSFFDYYSTHPNVVFLLGCIGNWDVELDFDVKDTKHFHELVMDMKNKFGDIIKNYDTTVFLEEYYLTSFD